MYGSMASKTLGSMGVVAWASRYSGRMVLGTSDESMRQMLVGRASLWQLEIRLLALLVIIFTLFFSTTSDRFVVSPERKSEYLLF
jgi:hypothetical protein